MKQRQKLSVAAGPGAKIDGKKKRISARSSSAGAKYDGNKHGPGELQQPRLPSKYTILRTKDHLKEIEIVRKYLQNNNSLTYKTDSKIYIELPKLFLNAVKTNMDQQLAIDELTAKLDQLEDLRSCFCRINEICKKR